MSGINIKNLNKKYGSFEAIPELDLDIEDGEFVILVGPSGCGKSTLLRMIAGLESITKGDIYIAEKRVNDLMPRQRDIAMVFQSYALYPHMTVAQNMGFSLKLEKRSKAEIEERVNEAAEILGLNPLLGRYPKQLSGGQRQRVAMGRSIVRDPQVFLFDEPLSNLDAKLRVQMRAEIKALHQRLKTTIVYVTHDQVEAMTMADRIVVMSDGKIEQVGSPLDLYDRPANRFVAEFLGSPAMNLIEGEISGSGAKTMFKTGDGFSLTIPPHKAAGDGRKMMMGFRPEHITIEGTAGQESAKATVGVLEPTGSTTLLTAMLGGTMITCELKERVVKQSGETVSLYIDPNHLLFFDKETGQRIDA